MPSPTRVCWLGCEPCDQWNGIQNARTLSPKAWGPALFPYPNQLFVRAPIVAYWFEKAWDVLQQHRETPFMTFGGIGDWFIETDSTNGADVA